MLPSIYVKLYITAVTSLLVINLTLRGGMCEKTILRELVSGNEAGASRIFRVRMS